MSNAGAITPVWRWQVSVDGVPQAGALLYTYLSGTSTPQSVYNNADLDVSHAHTNPVEADADGVFPIMYLAAVAYRMEVRDADGNVIYPAQDGIYDFAQLALLQPVASQITITAGENLTAGQFAYLSDGSGSKTAGKWYRTDATNDYSSTTNMVVAVPASISANATGLGLLTGTLTTSGLAAGSLYYLSSTPGGITVTAPSNVRLVGQATSTTTLAVETNLPQAASAASGMNALTSLLTGLFCDPTLATPVSVDGSYITTSPATLYTCPSNTFAIVQRVTTCNLDTAVNDAQLYILPSGGLVVPAYAIASTATQASTQTRILDGPWFLHAGDFISGQSATATGTDMSVRLDIAELPAQLSGVTLLFDDGSVLTNSFATYLTASAKSICYAMTICNTDTSARVVTVAIVQSGGSAANNKTIFASSVQAGGTVILAGPYVLDPNDFIQAKAATGAVVGFRLSAFQLT